MNLSASKLVTTTYRQHGLPVVTGNAHAEISAAPLCRRFRPSPFPPITVGVWLLRRLLTSARSRPALPQDALSRTGGRVRWVTPCLSTGPQSGSRSPSRPHARQISPNKNMNCQCTTAAFTLSPVPGGLRHLVLTRPETEPSMRFLFVGSHLCARASFGQPLAGLPLPSASSYICPTIGHYRYSYRGLSPHQFMPMSGVHNRLQPTAYSVRSFLASASGSG